MLQLLSLGSVVDNQGVLVSGTSNLELGLSEFLAVSIELLVNLDGSRLDVSSSGQFDEFLDVLDFTSHGRYFGDNGGCGFHHENFYEARGWCPGSVRVIYVTCLSFLVINRLTAVIHLLVVSSIITLACLMVVVSLIPTPTIPIGHTTFPRLIFIYESFAWNISLIWR